MKTDAQLQRDVMEELEFDPAVDAAEIGVEVQNGIVTLAGHVDNYSKKIAAERAARRVHGVTALVMEIDVSLPFEGKRSDQEIALAAEQALAFNSSIPDDLQVKLENGWITLTGKVDWAFERNAAQHAVSHLSGVRGVSNLITLRAGVLPGDVQTRIERAIKRQALDDVRDIRVAVIGGTVTLTGHAASLKQRSLAQKAAWSAPGVTSVIDEITIP